MLDKILASKWVEIAGLDVAELRAAALDGPLPRPFLAEPDGGRVQLIAELKRASPSRGLLAPHLDLNQVARIYAENGAAAISVLTDEEFFMGRLETLRELRASGDALPPLLRKDFVLAPAQLYQTRAAGADAVLLIVAALPSDGPEPGSLPALHALALELGLTPLVEVHSLPELERALRLPGLRLVGINNRDLSTFDVRLETTLGLRGHIPPDVVVVSESGIFTAADVARLAAAGVDAVLVGEALITAPDIGAKVRELSGVASPHDSDPFHIKICGLTDLDDVLAALDCGVDYLGFNFYAQSPRFVDPRICARIIPFVRRRASRVKTVGVFVNHSPAEVAALMDQCGLDLAQLHGDEDLEHLPALRGRAFKAVRGAAPADAELQAMARFGPGMPAFLLDAHAPGMYGGTGQTADWETAAALAARYPIFLAGGLTPDNVAAAIAQVNPWGVDVASGVESAPGKKDISKMKAFVKNVDGRIKV